LTLRFGSGEAEFPPHPPSASPSLWTPTEFVPVENWRAAEII